VYWLLVKARTVIGKEKQISEYANRHQIIYNPL
jgi:hypothetical protein